MAIVDLMLSDMNNNLADNNLHVSVSDAAKLKLVALGYNPTLGARPLRRVLQDKIADHLADYYLAHPDVTDLYADIDADTDDIIISKTEYIKA